MIAAQPMDEALVEAIPAPPVPRLLAPWSARAAHTQGDLELVHRWMQAPHVAAFWKQDWPLERWREELLRQLGGIHSLPCLVHHEGEPVAFLEVYRVVRDRLAGHYPQRPYDLGVHVAIGETGRTGQGLGRALLRAVAEGLLAAEPRCTRVVAEPDIRNAPSLRAFTAAGFRTVGDISLPDKTAALLVYPRSEEDMP
ncbi:GNAT family N-acetyltransferase [Archangium gephyra]|uniref:GNAT family N-acetyltransferase n=1 Tax=Archangium gephyra TaxID=48 RepID=UPI003B7DD040